MARYKDRQGNIIKCGDVVATAITINQERYLLSYSICIVKKKGRMLILDGPAGKGELNGYPRKQLQKIMPNTDLRDLWADWIREFRVDHEFNEEIQKKNADWQKILQHIKSNREDIGFEIFKKALKKADSYSDILDHIKAIKRETKNILDVKDIIQQNVDNIRYLLKKKKEVMIK